MHTSDTVDYGLLLEGEMWMEVDDGKEIRLEPGTCVVQRGTRHAWSNRSDAPALMMFVLVGGRRGSPPAAESAPDQPDVNATVD